MVFATPHALLRALLRCGVTSPSAIARTSRATWMNSSANWRSFGTCWKTPMRRKLSASSPKPKRDVINGKGSAVPRPSSCMPLPDIIEVGLWSPSTPAQVTVPGSKSITNRALVLAALAEGETTLRGALWSEDTQIMVECLQDLGFMVNVTPDPDEPCNRTITVYGRAGQVPRGGTRENPLELFVGNAGTVARFLTALVCLGDGVYRLHGVPRMHERPQAALFAALRQLGYQIESPNDKLPALVHGGGPRLGKCRVSIEDSSQFASGLLLCAKAGT